MMFLPVAPIYAPGELVWASVVNGIENRHSAGKLRPVVLIERTGGQWLSAGLTTRHRRADGSERVAVPDHAAVGLRRPGYLWGRAVRVAAHDLCDHIGWANRPLVEAIVETAGLGQTQRMLLLRAAELHHPAAARRTDLPESRSA